MCIQSYPDVQPVYLGINLNVDKLCNFDCPYCQVDRRQTSNLRFDQNEFQKELVSIIKDIRDGTVWKLLDSKMLRTSTRNLRCRDSW